MRDLTKTRRRWPERCLTERLLFARSFDAEFPSHEQIPRRLEVELRPVSIGGTAKVRTIVDMTSAVEVGICTEGDLERASLNSYDVWRAIVTNNGGKFHVDLGAQSIFLD